MAVKPTSITTAIHVNGRPVALPEDGDVSLLDWLRDSCGLTSPKDGCQPLGQCGCCTVLIDGKPRLSCTIKAGSLAGKEVTTLEGLSEETRRELAQCFVECGGVQCGFCIPGIAIRGHALCERNPAPTRAEIANDLRAHLCRCTGYTKIVDAIESLAEKRQNAKTPKSQNAEAGGNGNGAFHNHQIAKSPNHQNERIGGRLDRFTGADAVLGDRKFIDDIAIPGMAHAAMRFSDHPRALVKRINTSAAETLDGVIRVATAKDVPGNRFVGLIIPDWPIFIAEGEETRCVGDILAAVVAVDERTARHAAELIEIEYEIREPLTTPDEALKPDAPQIHPKGNLLSRSALVRGDVESALANSAHVVDGTWQTQAIEHMFLEPEACIAIPCPLSEGFADSWMRFASGELKPADDRTPAEDFGMHLLTQGQGIFDDRRQCCSILGWPKERMFAELVSNGGAFGGKEDMSIQGQTALLAFLARRPVKTVLSRTESIRLHPKRHPVRINLRVGADADGRITALRARIVGDKGAYASVGMKVLERSAGHAAGPYRIPAVDIEALAVYTNNPPCGAMRGFGANQSAFAIEGALDMIAEKVGIDGWEIRSRNILEPGDRFCTGQLLTKPFGLRKTLESVREIYRGAKFAGIACGIKNVGIGNGLPEAGRATLTIEPDGRITIRTGFTEMGQGLFTVLIQTAVEETGLPAELFTATADTRDAIDCGQTTGSRGTVLGAYGVLDAARKLVADLATVGWARPTTNQNNVSPSMAGQSHPTNVDAIGVAPANSRCRTDVNSAKRCLQKLVGKVYHGEWVCYKTDKFGAPVENPVTHLTYGFATQVVILDDTGKITKVVAAHDVGRAINPTLLEGQVEGSIHMGLGYALTEAFVVEGGHIVTDDVKSNGVLRAHQMPEIECIIVETADPDTPYGARGVGEIGLVPTAPAVASALYSFDRIRRYTLPMKDSSAARALTGKT